MDSDLLGQSNPVRHESYERAESGRPKSAISLLRTFKTAGCFLVSIAMCTIFLLCFPVAFLQPEEQLLLQGLSEKWVVNGPGFALYFPLKTRITRRDALTIDPLSYYVVTNTLNANVRVEAGPQLLFLGAFDEASDLRQKYVLEKGHYLRLLDKVSGEVRVEIGPSTVTPGPHEEAPDGKQKGLSLKKFEYVNVYDKSGQVRVVRGEGLVFPGPTERLGEKKEAHVLEKDEWIKLVDEATGNVRVELGEQVVFPGATERAATTVQKAIHVDDETAVLVRSKQDGQQRLITPQSHRGPFFPAQYDEIVEVRNLIRIEPHEVVIAADEKNHIMYYDGRTGDSSGLAVFLPPYYKQITMMWGSGTSAEDLQNNVVNNKMNVAYKVPVAKIDVRKLYAFFRYNVRTADKVEMMLEGTIVWQIVDVPKMFSQTPDPKGDVWYHVRQRLIQAVSRVTLDQFMNTFSDLTTNVLDEDPYYAERGIQVHEVSVIRYECANPSDAKVLEQIIQETTKRMNELTAQNSKNDVQRASIEGEIALEQQRTKLLELKAENDKVSASASGEAEGLKLATSVHKFMEVLNGSVPNATTILDLLKFYETQRTMTTQTKDLATGNASLFLTPKDLNLKMVVPGSGREQDEL